MVLYADGRFLARYSAVDHGEPAIRNAPAGDIEGRWSAGRYCLETLFIPRTHIATSPTLPNATDIVIIGDRLIVLGADSGMTDAAYERNDDTADATSDAAHAGQCGDGAK